MYLVCIILYSTYVFHVLYVFHVQVTFITKNITRMIDPTRARYLITLVYSLRIPMM